MTIFDVMKRSRDAAIYRMMYQSRMRAQVAGNAAAKPALPTPDVVVGTQDELKAALADVKDGGLIQMSADITLEGPALVVPANKTVTIDLNGKKISSNGLSTVQEHDTTDALVVVTRGGTLILDDTSSDKSGSIDGSEDSGNCCAIKLTTAQDEGDADANLVINGGTYIGKDYAVSGNGRRQGTNIIINGGTFKCSKETAVYQPQNGKLTINGGTFEGPSAVFVKSGEAVINGGAFTATASDKTDFAHNGGYALPPTGDAVIVEVCDYPGGYSSLEVNGGTFTSHPDAHGIASYAQNSSYEEHRPTKFVKGGSSNTLISEDLIADGHQCVWSEDDGKYIIKAV